MISEFARTAPGPRTSSGAGGWGAITNGAAPSGPPAGGPPVGSRQPAHGTDASEASKQAIGGRHMGPFHALLALGATASLAHPPVAAGAAIVAPFPPTSKNRMHG